LALAIQDHPGARIGAVILPQHGALALLTIVLIQVPHLRKRMRNDSVVMPGETWLLVSGDIQ